MSAVMMTNSEIAALLQKISEFLAMQEIPFKPRAYERAARTVEDMGEPIEEVYKKRGMKGIEEIPGVGVSIAEKIEEAIRTGHIKYYDELKKKTPVDIESLSAIEGVGPKTVLVLYKKLGIKTVDDLERAARAGKVRNLPHFGIRIEEKILKGIGFRKQHADRFLLHEAMEQARDIRDRLAKLDGVERVEVAGSLRRWRETIGDCDILVISDKAHVVMECVAGMREVVHVYAKGETKTMVRLKNGMDVDVRVVPRESFGAALNYFTGSKEHNVALRERAIKHGWKLNEYGLFGGARGQRYICGRTEEEIYEKLGLAYIEPELRENRGEIAAAQERKLPQLVGWGDLLGDLQVQSDWTDGHDSIEALAREAIRLGRKYIAITDHTKRLAMTRGLDEVRIRKQMAEIDKLNKKYPQLKILKGTECDILKDGSLDLPDSVLEQLDIVGVSVHSYFNMPRGDMTRRIVRAISNRHADILFHPTGRLVNKRPPYDADMEAVIAAAKATKTILEINASPERLDLRDEHIRRAKEEGVMFAIDSDAHSLRGLDVLRYGVAQARRGWVGKDNVINAQPFEKMMKRLK